MTTHEAESLRRDLRRHGGARGKRFDPELRRRIVAFAEQRRRDGAAGWRSRQSSVPASRPFRRWCGGGSIAAGRQLRRVEVVADPLVEVPARAPLAVVTPNGLRIEGVGIDDVVTLVRALG